MRKRLTFFLVTMLLTVFGAEAKFLYGDREITVSEPGEFYAKYAGYSYFNDADSITITGPLNEI